MATTNQMRIEAKEACCEWISDSLNKQRSNFKDAVAVRQSNRIHIPVIDNFYNDFDHYAIDQRTVPK